MKRYILALDQGTTSSRAIVFDHSGCVVSSAQMEFEQHYPLPDHVEHDPRDIWSSQLAVAKEAIDRAGTTAPYIAAIGIANQRETTILWDRATGQPVAGAIVWQSRISAPICERLKADGLESVFREKTGLVIDPYFSATKIAYLFETIPGLRRRAQSGEIAFGTVDAFLIWRLTSGQVHKTDLSNASRTMLFNIHTLEWDDELLGILDIPRSIMPEVCESSDLIGQTDAAIFGTTFPIASAIGDQQSATFGQACFNVGTAKNTYGTGCFLLLNTGSTPVESNHGMLTTIGWGLRGDVTYCLEGAVFVAGAVVQWLRDGLGIIDQSTEVEELASSVPDSDGVYMVPAFVGLGAPYWDPYARGTMVGITRRTTAAHIARAAVDSIAFQSVDLLEAMQKDAGLSLDHLKVDGGATVNDQLMQFQADLLGVPVLRPMVVETTALGAAYLAGLAVGFWDDITDITDNWALDREFVPKMAQSERDSRYSRWREAVERSRGWAMH